MFVGDMKRLLENVTVNPFDTGDFTAVNNNIVKSIKNISDLGKKQFKDFWNKRVVKAEVPITETILKNNLRLPRHMTDSKSGDAKDPILTSKMISYLRSAHQHRTEAVIKLFEPEIFGNAQSISSANLQWYSGTKPDITRRLATTSTQAAFPKSSIVIELSPIIKSKQSVTRPTFDNFAEIVYRSISYTSHGCELCDVVADQYFVGGLKEGTRKNVEMMTPQCSLLVILSFRLTLVIS